MIKQLSQLMLKVGEWESHWNLLPNTPLDVCKEMLFQAQKFIGQIEDQVKAQQEAQAAAEAAKKAAEPVAQVPKVEELEQPKE